MGTACSCCCHAKPNLPVPAHEFDPASAKDGTSPQAGADEAGKKRGGARKGAKDRIGAKIDGEGECEEHLEPHKRKRDKGKETRKIIKVAMKQDRVCALLEENEIETILETMEYFEFGPQECVVKQGDVGTTFFVTHEGEMEVSVNGRVVNTMTRGRAFGGLALLYNCPRTASVTSTSKSSAWGANGGTFHKVLQDNAKKSYAENRQFLDSIRLFDGLAVKQKDRVGEAFFVEAFEPGQRVVTEGEAATAMYFVKKGELKVVREAKIDSAGKIVSCSEIAKIQRGECFGERALLYNEARASTVVAESKCELLCISGDQLREVLGHDLRACLEQNVILVALQKSPVISQFSTTQQMSISKAIVIKDFKSGETIPKGLRFAVICDGEVKGKNDGADMKLGRAAWFEKDTVYEDFGERKSQAKTKGRKTIREEQALNLLNSEGKGTLSELVAGQSGARIAVLTEDALGKVAKELGLSGFDDSDFARKMILVKKVHIFRHLAQEALEKIVKAFRVERFKKGEAVIKQGDKGTKFFVIASGEVGVTISGNFIRTMPRNQFFGERALLFDEPRTATISVSTNEAEMWSIEKSVFDELVTNKMKEELTKRIKLQDTSVTMKDLKHVKVVGAGAAGVVRLVEHKKTKTRYALKRVYKVDGKVPEEVTRECALLAENDHPFIMTLVKTFELPKSVYMLTELITGGELHAAIRTIPTVLSRSQCQFYAGSLILVLEEIAERNIVYRDLKPENVMLDAQGYLKLIDFGIAKKLEEGKTKTFTMIGTPHYMAPEVMRGHGYGTEVDIWSFGVMCFEFVCGYLPFADDLDDPTEVCTAVLKEPLSFPSGYKDNTGKQLMQGLLSRQPKKRLGAGMAGYEDVKNHDYFKAGHTTSTLFTKILGRELDPPCVPPAEVYSPPEDLADCSLSDAGELG